MQCPLTCWVSLLRIGRGHGQSATFPPSLRPTPCSSHCRCDKDPPFHPHAPSQHPSDPLTPPHWERQKTPWQTERIAKRDSRKKDQEVSGKRHNKLQKTKRIEWPQGGGRGQVEMTSSGVQCGENIRDGVKGGTGACAEWKTSRKSLLRVWVRGVGGT